MQKLKPISGKKTIRILCKHFGFAHTGQRGSHVRLSKTTKKGKVGTVVPLHSELKLGTLRRVLKLANVSVEEFAQLQ